MKRVNLNKMYKNPEENLWNNKIVFIVDFDARLAVDMGDHYYDFTRKISIKKENLTNRTMSFTKCLLWFDAAFLIKEKYSSYQEVEERFDVAQEVDRSSRKTKTISLTLAREGAKWYFDNAIENQETISPIQKRDFINDLECRILYTYYTYNEDLIALYEDLMNIAKKNGLTPKVGVGLRIDRQNSYISGEDEYGNVCDICKLGTKLSKEVVVDKLIEFLREQINVKAIANNFTEEEVYSLNNYYGLLVNGQATEEIAKKVQLNDIEAYSLLTMIKEYLLSCDLTKLSLCGSTTSFLYEILTQMELEASASGKEYDRIKKYKDCITSNGVDIIFDDGISAIQIKKGYIDVRDYLKKIVVDYDKDSSDSFVLDFNKMFRVEDLCLVDLGNDKSMIGVLSPDKKSFTDIESNLEFEIKEQYKVKNLSEWAKELGIKEFIPSIAPDVYNVNMIYNFILMASKNKGCADACSNWWATYGVHLTNEKREEFISRLSAHLLAVLSYLPYGEQFILDSNNPVLQDFCEELGVSLKNTGYATKISDNSLIVIKQTVEKKSEEDNEKGFEKIKK